MIILGSSCQSLLLAYISKHLHWYNLHQISSLLLLGFSDQKINDNACLLEVYKFTTHRNVYTVLQIGFQQDVYEVSENDSFVTVCIELLEGSACCRPVNARLYTKDGNATGTGIYCDIFDALDACTIKSIFKPVAIASTYRPDILKLPRWTNKVITIAPI